MCEDPFHIGLLFGVLKLLPHKRRIAENVVHLFC